jgi:tetratricopeptide (TPR) repeat protein
VLRTDSKDQAMLENPGLTNSVKITAANTQVASQDEKAKPIQNNVTDMLKKGQNYFQTGQYDKAVMQFSRLIKSGGNRKVALYNRGVALFKLNKKDAAKRDFKYAAKLGHEKSMKILKKTSPGAA